MALMQHRANHRAWLHSKFTGVYVFSVLLLQIPGVNFISSGVVTYLAETRAFAERLKQALEAAGVRPSPTRVANEFNGRYWGKSITPHTARNWLIGKSIPTQDKLRVLSDWLHVSPDVLRFGALPAPVHAGDPWVQGAEGDLVDRELIQRGDGAGGHGAASRAFHRAARDAIRTDVGLTSLFAGPRVRCRRAFI